MARKQAVSPSRLAPLPLLAFVLLASGCTKMLEVNDVCETFVHHDTPPLSPQLRRTADGELELLVEVTALAEAQAILAEARKQPIDVLIYPSERYAHILRVEGDRLVVWANSPEHAQDLLDTLCIRPGDP